MTYHHKLLFFFILTHFSIVLVKASDESAKNMITDKPVSLPNYFAFLEFKKKPFPNLGPSIKANRTMQARWLKDNNYVTAYDKKYEEFQEFLALEDKSLTQEQLFEIAALFESINDQLNRLEDIEPIVSHDEILSGISSSLTMPSKTPVKQLGEIQEGDIIDDENIKVDSSSRFSILRKPSFGSSSGPSVEETLKALEVVTGVCQSENKKIVNIDLKFLDQNVEILEQAMLDESINIDERIKIYCVLYKIYETTENSSRIIEFLYLNMPADNIECL